MKERTILINVDKLELVGNDNDFIYILYNEFSLGAFLSKQNNVLVYTYGDKDVARLKRAVIKYGIDDKYYDELFGDKNETLKNKVKNNINFMGRITGVVNESESFTKALRLDRSVANAFIPSVEYVILTNEDFSVETDEDIDQLFDMVNDRVESVLGKTLEYIGIVTVEEFRDFLIDNANLLDREVADILGLGEEGTETENETEVLVDPIEDEVDDFETLYRKRQQMRQRGSEEFHESLSTKREKVLKESKEILNGVLESKRAIEDDYLDYPTTNRGGKKLVVDFSDTDDEGYTTTKSVNIKIDNIGTTRLKTLKKQYEVDLREIRNELMGLLRGINMKAKAEFKPVDGKMDIDKAKVLAFVDEFVKTSERTAIKNKIKPLIAEVNEYAELVDIMSDVLTVRSKTPAKQKANESVTYRFGKYRKVFEEFSKTDNQINELDQRTAYNATQSAYKKPDGEDELHKIKRIEQLGKFSSYTSPEIEALKKQAGVSEIRSYVGGYDLLIHTNKSDSGIVAIDVYPSTYSFSVGSADMIESDKVRFLSQLIKKLQASMKRVEESATPETSVMEGLSETNEDKSTEEVGEKETETKSTEDDKSKEDDKSTEDDKSKEDDKSTEDDEDVKEVEITALKVMVKKDAADKCKSDMIDAGIDEDDIEVLDGDDEDTSVIKVDANSIVKLKKYLDTKGIDLEEKLGGEIEEPEEDEDKKDAESADDGDEFEFDDSDLSDLFGDDVADEA